MITWKYWGILKNGEAVYVSTEGVINVEKDHRRLVQATPEEKREIYATWPALVEKAMKR